MWLFSVKWMLNVLVPLWDSAVTCWRPGWCLASVMLSWCWGNLSLFSNCLEMLSCGGYQVPAAVGGWAWSWLGPSSSKGISLWWGLCLAEHLTQVFGCLHTGKGFAESGSSGKLIWQRNEKGWWIMRYYRLDIDWDMVAFNMFVQNRQWRRLLFFPSEAALVQTLPCSWCVMFPWAWWDLGD